LDETGSQVLDEGWMRQVLDEGWEATCWMRRALRAVRMRVLL
jgi:hypothetical protein